LFWSSPDRKSPLKSRRATQTGLAAERPAGGTRGRPPKLTDEDIEVAKAMLANPDVGAPQPA
jgi:hypothetical protein